MRLLSRIMLIVVLSSALSHAQGPDAATLLNAYRPTQPDVDYDTPEGDELKQCRREIERTADGNGFVVFGPAGEVLRRFTDTNGDSQADVFRFYRMGLEVYRDIDANKNGKNDQHRWMNWGGTRWGIDRDEDGRIDEWKTLSAQEAAQVAIMAMIKRDPETLATVLINAKDLKALQTPDVISRKLLASVQDPTAQLRKLLSGSKTINSTTKWVRFDPPVPSLIPAEDGKAKLDLTVYQNAMAIVENSGQHQLISVGEMIQVGNVWKLTHLPMPLDTEDAQVQIGGILMQPQVTGPGIAAEPEMAREMEELLTALQKIDASSPTKNITPQALARYNQQRADVIEKVIRVVPTEPERIQWIQQFADGVAAAVQTGQYDGGLKRLEALEAQVKGDKKLQGYVTYRRLLGEYAVRLKTEDNKEREAAQSWWLKQLEVFAKTWPESEDAADAMVQLAISLELIGRVDDAKRWYTTLVKEHGRSNAGVRAQGALKRLDLAGKSLTLAGKNLQGQPLSIAQYRGRVTLVAFWATWAQPYTAELPKLTALYQKYNRSGFEILGVNLDADASGLKAYLEQYGGAWQHIRDAGGTDGQIAKDFGIVTVPTMFIVDKAGRVAGAVTMENVEAAVTALLQGKPLSAVAEQ